MIGPGRSAGVDMKGQMERKLARRERCMLALTSSSSVTPNTPCGTKRERAERKEGKESGVMSALGRTKRRVEVEG
eukprot:816799-Rhodomonas_salina.1